MVRVRWMPVLEALGLVVVLWFVAATAFLPHLDTQRGAPSSDYPNVLRLAEASREWVDGERRGYPYPLHMDEFVHWVLIASTQRQDKVVLDDPWSGSPADSNALSNLRGAVHEKGFHVTLAYAQEMTGVPWLYVFQFLPAAWMAFIAFGVYAALRPSPAALPAAFFVGLIPTTVRFLGPSFLVPIGFCMAWLPAVVILAEPARRRFDTAFLLFFVVGWSFFVHLIGGFAAVILLGFAAFWGAGREWRSSVAVLAIAVVPIVWLYRAFTADVQAELEREESLPINFTVFDQFGVPMLFAWGLGLLVMAVWPPKTNRGAHWAFGSLSAVALGLIVGGVALDLGKYMTYARWHPPYFLAAAIPSGYAVAKAAQLCGAGAKNLLDQWPRFSVRSAPVVALVVGVLLVPTMAATGLGYHMRERYYHVLEDDDVAVYTWVTANVGPPYEVFLDHPWKAQGLVAMSGLYGHTVLMPGAPPVNGEDYAEFVQTGGSLELFVSNDITMVLSTRKPPTDEFGPSDHPEVWLLRRDLAQQLYDLRAAERAAAS